MKNVREILEEAIIIARFTFNDESLAIDSTPKAIVVNASSHVIEPAGHSRDSILHFSMDSSTNSERCNSASITGVEQFH